MSINIDNINKSFSESHPSQIVEWALNIANSPVITTNFRPYESAILHLVTKFSPKIKVIWCDTGYNTPNTYSHAQCIIKKLDLNIHMYVPKQTASYRNVYMGVPNLDDPKHKLFTDQVKLEPFRRAMKEHEPDLWFTNLRKGQTNFRDSLGVISQDSKGLIKVSPFYNWSDKQLDGYLKDYSLPNEFNYFDPTKQLESRECGLHIP